MTKTTREYTSDVVKYAGPSAAVALAISEILAQFVPAVKPVQSAIALVLGFSVNIILAVLKSKGVIYKTD